MKRRFYCSLHYLYSLFMTHEVIPLNASNGVASKQKKDLVASGRTVVIILADQLDKLMSKALEENRLFKVFMRLK